METNYSAPKNVSQENEHLRSQVSNLITQCDELRRENERLKQNLIYTETSHSRISDASIRVFIENIVDEEKLNIEGLPDVLEKAIYRKVAKIMLLGVEKMLSNFSVDLIGHNISCNINPIREEKDIDL
jgi:hypothetical protein